MVDLAGMLGVSEGRSVAPLQLIAKIREGLPLSALDRIATLMQRPQPAAPGFDTSRIAARLDDLGRLDADFLG